MQETQGELPLWYTYRMENSVYIETTVVSYQCARTSRDVVLAARQQITADFWALLGSRYTPYVSALVINECTRGDPEQTTKRLAAIADFAILDIDREAEVLAQVIVREKGVPEAYPEDALHIAVAASNGISFVATWNFSHINNPATRKGIREIVERQGYECPEICSPEELTGDES